MRFRVMTYNIHKGIGGVDRRYQLERVAETIAHCEPDIVLLQEVDRDVPRSGRHDQAHRLAELLDFPHYAFQMNVHLTSGGYGNAVLSRYRVEHTWDLELTVPFKKRRRGLAVVVRPRADQPAHDVLVYNLHLGLAGYERRMQLRRLLGCPSLGADSHYATVILGGDFNDVWGNLGRQILEPVRFESAAGNFRTFPAVMPLRPLDRLFYRGPVRAEHSFVCQTQVARRASDHLPLVVDFRTLPGR
ncbi:MAG: endonuclease/exonuclease/phosphatase family protein [Pirellulales bacterium]